MTSRPELKSRNKPAIGKHAALAGIRVIDFSRVLAGPFSSQVLGDFGAEIIKWRKHDLVVWDNRCLVHSATGGYEAPMYRLMHRTTVAGVPPCPAEAPQAAELAI